MHSLGEKSKVKKSVLLSIEGNKTRFIYKFTFTFFRKDRIN